MAAWRSGAVGLGVLALLGVLAAAGGASAFEIDVERVEAIAVYGAESDYGRGLTREQLVFDVTERDELQRIVEAIDFLLRHLGFDATGIERLHPYPESARVNGFDAVTERVNGAFCGPQDYAIIGYKPA